MADIEGLIAWEKIYTEIIFSERVPLQSRDYFLFL